MTRTPDLDRFNPSQPGTRGMKLAATGLLVVMAAICSYLNYRYIRLPATIGVNVRTQGIQRAMTTESPP